MSFTKQEFLDIWDEQRKYLNRLNVMLIPAKEAIVDFYLHGEKQRMTWEGLEMEVGLNGQLLLQFIGTYHSEASAIRQTFTVPLETCGHGMGSVTAYLAEERRKQYEASRVQGEKRDARDKAEREELFKKLKLEFEPPEDAIVKHQDASR